MDAIAHNGGKCFFVPSVVSAFRVKFAKGDEAHNIRTPAA